MAQISKILFDKAVGFADFILFHTVVFPERRRFVSFAQVDHHFFASFPNMHVGGFMIKRVNLYGKTFLSKYSWHVLQVTFASLHLASKFTAELVTGEEAT